MLFPLVVICCVCLRFCSVCVLVGVSFFDRFVVFCKFVLRLFDRVRCFVFICCVRLCVSVCVVALWLVCLVCLHRCFYFTCLCICLCVCFGFRLIWFVVFWLFACSWFGSVLFDCFLFELFVCACLIVWIVVRYVDFEFVCLVVLLLSLF